MRHSVIALFSLGLLAAFPCLAAPSEKESTYEIEVVVFENRLPDLIGDEMLAKPADTRIQSLENVAIPEPAVSEPYLYPSMTTLMEQDGHYRVLAHQLWQQTVDAKTIAKPIRIVGNTPGELDGTIRFYMSRFLHLDADLVFRENISSTDQPGAILYRLTEQRKLKSQEINYFDHPKFGLLVRIMPLEKVTDKDAEKERTKL